MGQSLPLSTHAILERGLLPDALIDYAGSPVVCLFHFLLVECIERGIDASFLLGCNVLSLPDVSQNNLLLFGYEDDFGLHFPPGARSKSESTLQAFFKALYLTIEWREVIESDFTLENRLHHYDQFCARTVELKYVFKVLKIAGQRFLEAT